MTPKPASRVGERLVSIVQGQFHIDDDPDVRISTVLGSCISVCLHDPLAKLGGLNHFMLPQDRRSADEAGQPGNPLRYGTHAMEELINALMRRGAQRQRLQAKVFGGGAVMAGLSDVGAQNIAFIRAFLAQEGFRTASEDVGGRAARRVIFAPTTGQAWVKKVDSQMAGRVGREELACRRTPTAAAAGTGDVELF